MREFDESDQASFNQEPHPNGFLPVHLNIDDAIESLNRRTNCYIPFLVTLKSPSSCNLEWAAMELLMPSVTIRPSQTAVGPHVYSLRKQERQTQ